MTTQSHPSLAYVELVRRHMRAIFVASAVVVAASIVLAAYRLPLQTDFSSLLPASSPSVVAATKLAQRAPARDTMLVMIVAYDPATRAAAGAQALAGIRAIDRDLVERAESDDIATR